MTPVRTTKSHPAPDAAVPEVPNPDVDVSKGRRVAFRVMAAVTSLWVLALMIFGLIEVVLMWLPRDMLMSMEFLEPGELDLSHRAHFMSVGVVAWALVLGVFVQLRRPARRVAPLLHASAITLGGAALFAISGGLGDWLIADLSLVVLLALLVFLHPRARQLVSMPTWNRDMTALAAVGAVPWLLFAATQTQLQWRNVAGDTHASEEHWAAVALLALIIVACAFIGATDRTGWRLTAWIATIAAVNYGLHSLVYPGPPSAAPTLWAFAAIAWGVAYAATIIRRSRAVPPVARAA